MKHRAFFILLILSGQSFAMQKEQSKKLDQKEKIEKNTGKPYRKEVAKILRSGLSPKSKKDQLFNNLTISSRELNGIVTDDQEEEAKNTDSPELEDAGNILEKFNVENSKRLRNLLAERLEKLRSDEAPTEDQEAYEIIMNMVRHSKK